MTNSPDIYDWLLYQQELQLIENFLEAQALTALESLSNKCDQLFWDLFDDKYNRQSLIDAYKQARSDMAKDSFVQSSAVWGLNITTATWNFRKTVARDRDYWNQRKVLMLGMDYAQYIQLHLLMTQRRISMQMSNISYVNEELIGKEIELQGIKERWEEEFEFTAQNKKEVH